VDGVNLGMFGSFGSDALGSVGFSQLITIPLSDLTDFLSNGSLHVRIDLGTGVDTDLSSIGPPTFSARLTYGADDGGQPPALVPEPTSLALIGIGLLGLGFRWRNNAAF
jgi:hypothetical protein